MIWSRYRNNGATNYADFSCVDMCYIVIEVIRFLEKVRPMDIFEFPNIRVNIIVLP